jgi:hypothetical protein
MVSPFRSREEIVLGATLVPLNGQWRERPVRERDGGERLGTAGYGWAADFFRSVGRATVDAAVEVVGEVVDENRRPIAHDGGTEGELAVRRPR